MNSSAAAILLAGAFPGIDGFLGTRASIMLDVIALAMLAVLSLMSVSILLVRFGRRYAWHKRIQLVLGVALLLTIAAFEVDVQFLTKWQLRAAPSPYFVPNYSAATEAAQIWSSTVGLSLLVHLAFAVPTALLWIVVIAQALRRFPKPPQPSSFSRHHIRWARLAALGMTMTTLTGWVFYYLAFVA